MDALQQRVEVELTAHRYRDLAVEDEPARRERAHEAHHLGKISRQGLTGLRLEHHGVAFAEGQAPEAVPFRLEEPAVAAGNGVDELGLHRRIWRRDGQTECRPL